ncbi:MAG: outer membrane efflux [Geobacteraceae bacterium]|nr:MAG: outer membrane efflux [Geobacteraceae bacterium]
MSRILFIALIFLFPVTGAHAVTLTLEECVELALKNNSGLKSFATDVTAAGAEMGIARAALFPSLKLKATYSLIDRPERLIINRNTFAPGIPPQDVEVSTGKHDRYDLAVIVEQPLFTGGRLFHSLRRSAAVSDETLINEERQKKLLVFEVKRAFFTAITAGLNRELQETITEAKKERLLVLEEQYREGYVKREDLLRQETDITFAEFDLLKRGNGEALALRRLKNLVYLQADEELELVGAPRNMVLTTSLQEVMATAARNRDELKEARLRLRRAEEEIAVARSGYYPQASLLGKYIQQQETNLARPEVWMLTAQLEWSIFEWGRTNSEVKKKEAQRERVRLEREELERYLAFEAESAWREVKEREKGVEAHESGVKSAEYTANLSMERYAEGMVKLVDVIEKEAEFVRAANLYYAAVSDLNSATAALELATSGDLAGWFTSRELYTPKAAPFFPRNGRPKPDGSPISSSAQPQNPEQVGALPPVTPVPSPAVTPTGELEPKTPEKEFEELLKIDGRDAGEKTVQPFPTGTEYIVKPGDNLFRILVRGYGLSTDKAAELIPEIKRLNGISDIRRLKVGAKIKIPSLRLALKR